MAGSPGPNNIMLTASGTNYGLMRTIPHMFGIILGMLIMQGSLAAGLGVVFEQFPILHDILRFSGAAFLLYIAWRIATASGGIKDNNSNDRPMNILEATAFQFMNPKAWLINISAITTFSVAGPNYWLSTLLIGSAFVSVMIFTLPLWTTCGIIIRRWLSTPLALKRFNWGMGALTAGSVAMILN